jgi:mannose-6-phosphate isomerase-like protein (cupin superfamily)
MANRPPKIVALDEIEPLPGPGTLSWHPVRHALGIRAFGCNAYTAHAVGDDVVEPHTEAAEEPEELEHPELMHEELYFVAAGFARFTIDGVEHDAPAGTYVFIPDPNSHRHAVAVETPTTVLSFGGPPTFEPSAWEWLFRADALIDTDPGQAREILADGIEKHPESVPLRALLAVLQPQD